MNILHAVGWGLIVTILSLIFFGVVIGLADKLEDKTMVRALTVTGLFIGLAVFLLTL